MEPRTEILPPKTLVGLSMEMSAVTNRTSDLWRAFRPRMKEIRNRTTQEAVSMRVYLDWPSDVFGPQARFHQWAAVEVADHGCVPEGMQPYTLVGGLYAHLEHHGPASDLSTFQYIFSDWLPASQYELDRREHFEVLPSDYDPRDPDAREQVFVPVRKRT